MRYVSVCSGIEAASVAWEPLGFMPVSFAEIEAFPSAVLAHHWPDVPNIGNMEDLLDGTNRENFDLLVGGTPCQSFSVAGLRRGLDDPRGNLMLTYGAIADAYKPRWIVWENVPGVLSSNKGRDFGTFLGMLAKIGYGFAYRVLDAQYFGVPQRRRRVFVVGHLGDWRRAAAVLFESESLQGDTKQGRKKRVQVARCVMAGTGRRIDAETETLIAFHGRQDPIFSETMLPLEAKGGQCVLQTAKTKEVKDASSQEKDTRRILRILWQKIGEKAFTQWGFGILISFYPQEILRQALHGSGLRLPARTRDWLVYNALSCEENCSARFMLTLREAECERYSPQGWEPSEQLARQLGAYMSKLSQPAASGEKVLRDLWSTAQGFGVLRQTLSALQEVGRSTNCKAKPTYSMQVRRLAPEECEFLQGFPRNHTRIPWRGKPPEDCPDGPRYKALGNSMAVPVMRWIGERIRKYETANVELRGDAPQAQRPVQADRPERT